MSQNIKTRQRILQDLNAINQKIKKIENRNPKFQKSISNISNTKKVNLKLSNYINYPTTIQKGLSPRDKETQKIIFQSNKYEFILVEISEFQKGFKLILNFEEAGKFFTSAMTFNLFTMQIQKNKVFHSFKMPSLSSTTKYIKILIKWIQGSNFKMTLHSLRGKLKQKNFLLVQTLQQPEQIISIDPFLLIEQSQNIRRKRFGNIQNRTMNNSKLQICLEDVINIPKIQISNNIKQIERNCIKVIEQNYQIKKYSNRTALKNNQGNNYNTYKYNINSKKQSFQGTKNLNELSNSRKMDSGRSKKQCEKINTLRLRTDENELHLSRITKNRKISIIQCTYNNKQFDKILSQKKKNADKNFTQQDLKNIKINEWQFEKK